MEDHPAIRINHEGDGAPPFAAEVLQQRGDIERAGQDRADRTLPGFGSDKPDQDCRLIVCNRSQRHSGLIGVTQSDRQNVFDLVCGFA